MIREARELISGGASRICALKPADHELVGLYDTFDAAAADAVKRFGSGPYLMRQIGAPPVTLPAS